ncbi:hypothetical protein B0H10DRAFT_404830 [Mycena sp. CBHHK59/15]|nr:hypothetical protein B0H10DRAFT_404830 [Mycena sp. CBHHK59/15]
MRYMTVRDTPVKHVCDGRTAMLGRRFNVFLRKTESPFYVCPRVRCRAIPVSNNRFGVGESGCKVFPSLIGDVVATPPSISRIVCTKDHGGVRGAGHLAHAALILYCSSSLSSRFVVLSLLIGCSFCHLPYALIEGHPASRPQQTTMAIFDPNARLPHSLQQRIDAWNRDPPQAHSQINNMGLSMPSIFRVINSCQTASSPNRKASFAS